MHAAPRLIAMTLLASALLSACSDDSSSPAPGGGGATLNVTPSLGKIINAAVEARCAATGSTLGSGTLGSSGTISLATTGSCAGPVIVEVFTSASSQYFDEKSGTLLTPPAGTQLRALLPSLSGSTVSVGVTPLTEIAFQRALALAAGSEAAITTVQANTANGAVAGQLFGTAGSTLDILQPPTLWDAATTAGSLTNTAAGRYALLLATLAGMGSGATPALAATQAIAADLADGTLSGSSAAGLTYTSGNFNTLRNTAFSTFTSYAAPALQTSLQTALGVSTGGGDALLDFLPAMSDDWIILDATDVEKMATSASATAGGWYNRTGYVDGILRSVESAQRVPCTISVSTAGMLTISVNSPVIGNKTTSISLIGKQLNVNKTLELRLPGDTTFTPVHGYVIWLGTVTDVNASLVWADDELAQGPANTTLWVVESGPIRQEYTCEVQ